jgi:hypothetical protein
MDIFVWLVEWYVFIISICLLCAYLQYHNFFLYQEAQSGVAPSYIETYIRGHHGPDPTQPDLLCSDNATQTLVSKII